VGRHSLAFYLVVVTGLIVVITSYELLSPILLSFILIVLITLAVNPVVLRLRALTGGRKLATALVTLAFIVGLGLAVWAFVVPIKTSTAKLVQRLPEYWERVQKPLIRLEKQAAMSEAKLEQEVTSEVAQGAARQGDHEKARTVLEDNAKVREHAQNKGSLRSNISGMFQGAAGGVKSIAYTTAQMGVVLITVFFGVVF
jgi:predicted PurR-regulated permease PerM